MADATKTKRCPDCKGYGTTEMGPTPDTTPACMPCQGTGRVPKVDEFKVNTTATVEEAC